MTDEAEPTTYAALSARPGGNEHPDDDAVDRFAAAMKAKLAAARAKGRGGWERPDVIGDGDLARMLVEHLVKANIGTFVDIANFAMMLHLRGANPTVLAEVAHPAPAGELAAEARDRAMFIRRASNPVAPTANLLDRLADALSASSARAEAAERRAEEAENRAEELEDSAERVAHEFEGQCWEALRALLDECDYDWSDGEPVSADDAYTHVLEVIRDAERRAESAASVSALSARLSHRSTGDRRRPMDYDLVDRVLDDLNALDARGKVHGGPSNHTAHDVYFAASLERKYNKPMSDLQDIAKYARNFYKLRARMAKGDVRWSEYIAKRRKLEKQLNDLMKDMR